MTFKAYIYILFTVWVMFYVHLHIGHRNLNKVIEGYQAKIDSLQRELDVMRGSIQHLRSVEETKFLRLNQEATFYKGHPVEIWIKKDKRSNTNAEQSRK